MTVILALKLAALGFALVSSVRGRFWGGVFAVALLSYTAIAPLLASIPPYVELPLGPALKSVWWIVPTAAIVISVTAMGFAFRASSQQRDDELRQDHLQHAGFSFLGNLLVDLAALVIVGVGYVLSTRI